MVSEGEDEGQCRTEFALHGALSEDGVVLGHLQGLHVLGDHLQHSAPRVPVRVHQEVP